MKEDKRIEELERENKYMRIFIFVVLLIFTCYISINMYLTNNSFESTQRIILTIDNRTDTTIQMCNELYYDNFSYYYDCINYFVPLPEDLIIDINYGY